MFTLARICSLQILFNHVFKTLYILCAPTVLVCTLQWIQSDFHFKIMNFYECQTWSFYDTHGIFMKIHGNDFPASCYECSLFYNTMEIRMLHTCTMWSTCFTYICRLYLNYSHNSCSCKISYLTKKQNLFAFV